ncbi:MAG: hypothetical protein V7752_14445 [Halopseudomonas sp.]
MDNMATTLEAIQSLPAEYRDRINKYCIAGDSDSLAKALDVALMCFQELSSRDGLNAEQKGLTKILESIRKGLAIALLELEGFDLEAAKSRGKAETSRTAVEPKKSWSKAVAPLKETVH